MPRAPALIALLALVACPRGSDIDPDTLPWDAVADLYGVPNLDDDDGNGSPDWDDIGAEGDDSLSSLVLPAALVEAGTVVLDLGDQTGQARIWSGGEVILRHDTTTWAVPDDHLGDLVLEVEWADYLASADLTVTLLDEEEVELRSATATLVAAPLTLNHHLQAGRTVYVTRVNLGGGYDNTAMLQSLQEIFGDDLVVIRGQDYGSDPWVQDQFEFGWLWGQDADTEVVVNSIRSRFGLEDYPENELEGPDRIVGQWGRGQDNSLDAFGNLEITPPVDGYPLGRIYFGGAPDYHPVQALWDFLVSQGVQAPLMPDSTWLCVGHVDEIMTFLPDATAPKGFRFYVTDVDLAWEILEGMDPDTRLQKYVSSHGYGTVGEMLEDTALWMLNQEAQVDYVEPTIDLFKAELGLTDEDIVRVPQLFEHNRWCGEYAMALMPGIINMLVATDMGGATQLVMPDPFFRPASAGQEDDPLIAAYDALLPAEAETWYVDNWSVYHEGGGEVHCGTNTLREPPTADWWAEAMDLLEVSR